jgi:hypothetical protein
VPKVQDKRENSENNKREVSYKGILIRLIADLSEETLQAAREWDIMGLIVSLLHLNLIRLELSYHSLRIISLRVLEAFFSP